MKKKIENMKHIKTFNNNGKIITELKPPAEIFPVKDLERFDIFLAGSIEQGKAEHWQKKFVDEIKKINPKQNVVLFNPRRNDYNSLVGEDLIEQIKWELEHLESANLIVMYLQPGTMSRISLLEFGLFANRVSKLEKQMIVLCPTGFHAKDNIDITSEFYKIPLVKDMKSLINETKLRIKKFYAVSK